MQTIRSNRKLQTWSAAMAALAVSAVASSVWADTYTTPSFTGGQIGLNASNSFNANSFVDIYGSGQATKQSYGVFDFNASNLVDSSSNPIAPGTTVTSVNSIQFDMFNSSFSGASKTPITVNFYLATDTTTSPLFSSTGLQYKNPSDLGGGLNNPGNPGSFAAGTSLFSLGSDTYMDNGTSGTDIPYHSLTLNAAASSYLKNGINNSGDVRLVITTSSTGAFAASFSGTNNQVTAPLMTLDLSTLISPPNNSALKLTTAPTGYTVTADGKGLTTSVDFGRVFKGGTPALKTGAVITDTGTDPASVHVITTMGGHATVVGSNNIAAGGNTTASIGLSGVDTNVAGGTDITPTVSFQNFSNANDPSIVVNTKAHVVEGRFLDTPGANAPAPNFGSILVGATQTKPLMVTTQNTDTNGNLSTNSIVAVTLKANATANFSTFDPYTNLAAGKLTVTAPAVDQPVDGTVNTTANLTGTVKVSVSGVYGDGHAVTIGTTNHNYTPNFAQISGATKLTGEGLAGESDTSRSYAQWTGYQAASLSGNTATPLDAGGVATISNAPSSDNIFMSGGTAYNLGFRADARIASAPTFNQGGWSQTGLVGGPQGTGNVIAAGNFDWVNNVQLPATTASGTLAFDPTNKINGTYTATMSVPAEHDAQYNPADGSGIFGTSPNDLPAVQFPLQHASNTAAGTGAGNYTLDGGGLVAPDTNLTGTFTQTGGTATFGHITGGGTITNGANTTLTAASIRQSSLTVNGHVAIAPTPTSGDPAATSVLSSLTVAGGGQLDLGNNGLVLNYSGASPLATFASQVHSGNIITSLASNDQALGFGEVSDVFGAAGGTFLGQTITGSQKAILARYTRMGDANLDGKVDFSDFVALSTHFGQADPSWAHGNFLGDPTVDFADFVALSTHFGTNSLTAEQSAVVDAFAEAHSSTIPEPASFALAGLGAMGLLARRRRG